MLPTIAACTEQSTPDQGAEVKRQPILPLGTKVELTLTGYNYTDRYINQFSVNGNGGGNLFVSSPTSGGGGSACCVRYRAGVEEWKLRVRWQAGACKFNTNKYDDGREWSDVHSFYKEVDIYVDPKVSDRPAYLEVHFYPDGHVEAAVTEHSSPPRLKLNKDREIKTPYEQCPNDKRPEE